MIQVLEIDQFDDITSIRSQIELALSKLSQQALPSTANRIPPRLLLIVPRQNKALHNLVNMKLVARLVKSRTVQMAIVSSHPRVRDNAKVAELKTFSSLRTAGWAGWNVDQTVKTPVEAATSQPTEKKSKRVKKKRYEVVPGSKPSGKIQQLFQQLGTLLLIFILAIALVVGAVALLPEATVTLTPVAQPIEASLVVAADPSVETVDFRKLTFPARIEQVELDLAGEIETSKTELAPVGKASGRVVFINRTEDEQLIPISTTVSTSAGELIDFTTGITVTIPAGIGATTTPTLVIALKPGLEGNVPTSQINRFKDSAYNLVARVVNEEPIGGGSLEPARIVEEPDKERLDAHLRQEIQQEGLNRLQASLNEQEFIPPESVQVIVLDMKYREFSGDFSDTFGGEMQAVVRATVIGGYNANRLALAALEAQVPPGFELDLEGLKFGAGRVVEFREQSVLFEISASGQAIPIIDNHQVAEDVAWLSIGEAQDLLGEQYTLATVPGVDLSPDWLVEWLGRLPFSSLRINVIINEAVSLVAEGE